MKLNVGGTERREGWTILNIQPGKDADFVGSVADLSQFRPNSIDEIYASHVLEHLGYQQELQQALGECFRVLKQGGRFKVSVPDMAVLAELLLREDLETAEQIYLMRVVFGGQTDNFDFHKMGFTQDIMAAYLSAAGFSSAMRVKSFGLFRDCSEIELFGERISLNIEAVK